MVSGTTAALILLNCKTKKAVTLNIGDSSVYIYKDRLIFEAIEHTPKIATEVDRINIKSFVIPKMFTILVV